MKIKFSKSFKILGIVVASIIVLVLIVRGVWNLVATNKLNATVEGMQASEKIIDIKEYEVKCDDSENAALPWKEIEKMYVSDDVKLISDSFNKILAREILSPEEKAKIKEAISKNKPSFEKLKEVLQRPHFKYETNWDQSPYAFTLPRYSTMLRFMKLSGLDAFLKAEEGKVNEAIDQCLSWLSFTSLLSDEPLLISYLLRMAVARYQIAVLNSIISSRKFDDDVLKNVLNTLDSDEWQRGLTKSLDSERASIYVTCTDFLKGEERVKEAGISIYSAKFLAWLFRPLLKADIRHSMNLFDEMDEASQMPYHEFFQIRESYDKKFDEIPRYYVLSNLLVPNVVGTFLKKAVVEAKILTARAGIACKIYQKRSGEFPEKLSQLVPDILPEVPIDPFSGKPLIYRRTASGFIVYSIGSNAKDDGGRENMTITRIVAEKDDDWVWYEGKE